MIKGGVALEKTNAATQVLLPSPGVKSPKRLLEIP